MDNKAPPISIEDKIAEASRLQECLDRTERFLELLKEGRTTTGQSKTPNYFTSLGLTADICTGSQSSEHGQSIFNDKEFLKLIAAKLKPLIEDRIEEIRENLNDLIK